MKAQKQPMLTNVTIRITVGTMAALYPLNGSCNRLR